MYKQNLKRWKSINEEIFKVYFLNHTPLFLAKEFYNSNQNINDEVVKHINDSLIELKKDINTEKIRKIKNPNKIVDIVQKILNFNKRQKGKGLPSDLARIARVATFSDHSNLRILTPKEIL